MKIERIQTFKAPKASLKNYTFLLTDYTFLLTEFVIYITWNSSKFRSWNWLVKNISFFANPLVFEKTWNNSNFQSSNILLKNFIHFANRFGVWYNLNYLRFRAWLACLKNSTLPRTDSWYNLENLKNFVLILIAATSQLFRKPYSYLKKLERIQTFKARISCLGTSFFLRIGSAYDITWFI